jgi:(p)ppGpp synthase/HD superfamily hydrolase
MLSKAISITAVAFEDELDKGGVPYILHCLHVMDIVGKKTNKDPELMQIAVMHDLVEDTKWCLTDLESAGFSARVVAGVASMTHDPYETYDEYIAVIAANPDAKIVKLVDLKHNMDPTRMKGLREKDFARIAKYHLAYATLTGRTL